MTTPTNILQTQTVAEADAWWSTPLSLNQFNPSDGTPTDVQVGVTGTVTGSASIENLGAAAVEVQIGLPGTIDVAAPDGTVLASVQPVASQVVALAAYDGTTDFGGASGTVVSGISNTASAVAIYAPGTAGPVEFVGTGTLDLTASSTATSIVAGNGNLLVKTQAQAGATVSLQYDYQPTASGGSGDSSSSTSLSSIDGSVTIRSMSLGLDIPNDQTTVVQTLVISDRTTNWNAMLAANQFDPSLGTLEAVNLTLIGDINAGFSAENLGSIASSANMSDTANVAITLPGSIGTVTAAPSISSTATLGAFDGTIDFGGTSGSNATGLTNTGTIDSQINGAVYDLSSFIGSGTIALPVDAYTASLVTGPGDLESKVQSMAGATIEISYVYLPVASGAPSNPAPSSPVITGTASGQAATDQTTIAPFAHVLITDANVAQTETVTVTLSAKANGTLTNLGGGSYNAATGVYTDIGSAAAVTTALDGLIFTPTTAQVALGDSVTTTFTINDTDTASASTADGNTSVFATATLVPTTITGTVADQAISAPGTIAPFSGVVITDPNLGQTRSVTMTVTLSDAANGTLTNLGGGSYNAATGVYTDRGSDVSVTTALDGLAFIPTAHQVAPGQTVTTTFTISDTDSAGASATDTTTSVIATAGTVATIVPNDFSGTGTSDVLFENTNSGLFLDWQMSNGTLVAGNPIAGASSGWSEVGTGDFYGDHTSDILFKNSDSGLVLDWQMSNGTLVAGNPIAGAAAGWNVIGTGDFNGDGTSDILFQNSDSGLVLDWQMSNGTLVAGNPIAGATFDWKFLGTGDFNGDGTSDILFQNSNSGLVLDWQMSNGAFVSSNPIAGATTDWKEVGTGDFTGNGTDDILFQNSNSGDILYWEMTNGQFLKNVSVGTAAPGWNVIGTGDYTGSGTTGILLQNSSSGQLMDWELANGTLSKAIPIAGATSDWKVM